MHSPDAGKKALAPSAPQVHSIRALHRLYTACYVDILLQQMRLLGWEEHTTYALDEAASPLRQASALAYPRL